MQEEPVAIRFYSWLKSGFGRAAADVADAHGLPQAINANLSVSTRLEGRTETINHNFELAGPGDITTLDSAAVSSVNPKAGSRACPPNLFPYVEFSDAGLPWQYTPAVADEGSGRLAPWFALVVVEEGSEVTLHPAGSLPNFCLSIASGAGSLLPDPLEAYNWMHIEERDGRKRARALAPVRMKPNASYLACLVPLFEAGKQAGLGRSTTDVSAQPAWDTSTDALDLPVYYHWRFRTGAADFETLARRLVPRMAGEQAGLHDLDLANSGGGLDIEHVIEGADARDRLLVSFAGGLVGPEVKAREWPKRHKEPYQRRLTKLLSDRPKDKIESTRRYSALDDDPAIGPPSYGRWQAKPRTLAANQQRWSEKNQFGPGWMAMVNGDPALRAAAGLGAQVVVRNQEEFVAKAWTELKGIKEVAAVLRNARTAMAASKPMHAKLAKLSAPRALQITEGVHDIVAADKKTGAVIAQKTAVNASDQVLSNEFARLGNAAIMKSKRAGKRVPKPQGERSLDIAESAISIAVSGKLQASEAGLYSPIAGTRSKSAGAWTPAGSSGGIATMTQRSTTLHPSKQKAVKPNPAGNLKQFKSQAVMQLDPAKTVPELVKSRINGLPQEATKPGKIVRNFSFPLEFDEPTYRRLQKLEPDFLMPGFSAIPEDTVTIVEANPKFIEAFLIGMNHEMSREFAWRQMPLLLNGDWFRKFWDYRGDSGQTDIDPVSSWNATRPLGGNADRPEKAVLLVKSELFKQYPRTRVYAVKAGWESPSKGRQLVDATRAPGTDKKVRRPMLEDPAHWHEPIFDGKIGASAQFFGFDLSAEDLVGQGNDPGYFLMFEQGARDTQFGLDVADGFGRRKPSRADNLHWGHFAANEAELNEIKHVPSVAPWGEEAIQQSVWGRSSADTARLCLQRKVRILFPAGTLIDSASLAEGN